MGEKSPFKEGEAVEEISKNYFAVLPADVRYDKKLKDKAKLLYGEITALCNEKGYCWASNSYFAELYGISKETVSRLISNLCGQGYLNVEIIHEGKVIKERRIHIQKSCNILTKSSIPLLTETSRPIDENVNHPIDENVKENNTLVNNTINNKNIIREVSEKPSLQIKNLRLRYDEIELKIIDAYLDILRWTRKHGKIADTVVLKIYQEWEKFPKQKVLYALNLYVSNPKHHDKKENYCYGIMRNASAEEASKGQKPQSKYDDL